MWKRCRIPEVLQAHADEKVEEAKTKFVKQYLKRRLLHDGNPYHEGEALRTALEIQQPKLICGTVPMIGMLLQVWEQNFDMDQLKHLVVDEGGLLPDMFFMAMIASSPNIERVLVTGDQYQLPPYTGALPVTIVSLGHECAIEKLIGNLAFRYVSLSKNFKSHPIVVEALSVASYNWQLVPGRTVQEQKQWRVLGFPSSNDSLPILMLQITGWEQLALERSWSKDLHNEAVVRLRRFIVDKILSARIVILCYHSASLA